MVSELYTLIPTPTAHFPPFISHLSGPLLGATGDNVVARGEELLAGELPPVHPLRVHQLGQLRGRAGHSARKDGVAGDDAALAGDDVRHGQ